MFTRLFRWVRFSSIENWAYTRITGLNILVVQFLCRKDFVGCPEEILDFHIAGARIPGQRRALFNIGSAQQGHPFPGEGKYRTAIIGMPKAHRASNGQALIWKNEMAAP